MFDVEERYTSALNVTAMIIVHILVTCVPQLADKIIRTIQVGAHDIMLIEQLTEWQICNKRAPYSYQSLGQEVIKSLTLVENR